MESKSSLNRSIDNATKHYSSMFFLPSFKKILFTLAVLCILAIGLSTFALFPSIQGLIGSLILGFSLFALTLVADLIMSKLLLRGDPIYSLRRILALSFFSWLFWFAFIFLGVVLSFPFGWLLWAKLCLLGYGVIITLRIIVLVVTSMAASWRKGISVLLEPTLCLVAFVVFWNGISNAIPLQVLPFIIISPAIALTAVLLFLFSIERFSRKISSIASISLFRAFIINWVTGLNAPLERYLEEMGEDIDIEVTLLKFDASKPKAAIIVPHVHPGPFKNVGSSLLPSLLKHGYEKEFGCDTCIPLGILGHELDLASQEQNNKIVSQVIASAKFEATADLATQFVKASEGPATASCQIFGDTALLSFTLAPKTTEDLPQELGRIVSEQAQEYGLKNTLVVNTHNSLNDIADTEQHLDALQIAASKCLQKVVTSPTKQFMVGAASVFPKDFSLKSGMGTGGITAIIVQVEKQKTAYIIIDGNNMIPNLREKVLAALACAGFEESEVFTTDTHAVNALVTGRRGYHPVGEVMDNAVLIRYICEVAKKAESNLEVSNAGCLRLVIPQVRVIGEERLKSITVLVDKGIQKAKQTLIPIFGLEGLVLVLLLTLF
jgi:putative membrane protein